MKKIALSAFTLLILLTFFIPFEPVGAEENTKCLVDNDEKNAIECHGEFIDKEKCICLNVPIGSVTYIEVGKDANPLHKLFQTWYGFAIGIVGIMATVIIMYAGILWMTSRGNAQVISDQKDRIWSAITGLVLAFLSFTILNLINPDLLNIGIPVLKDLKPDQVQQTLQNLPEICCLTSTECLTRSCQSQEDGINISCLEQRCMSLLIDSNIAIKPITGMGCCFDSSDTFCRTTFEYECATNKFKPGTSCQAMNCQMELFSTLTNKVQINQITNGCCTFDLPDRTITQCKDGLDNQSMNAYIRSANNNQINNLKCDIDKTCKVSPSQLHQTCQ